MKWLVWGAAAAGWCLALGALMFGPARASRRETGHAVRLRALVEPYLMRRAHELGITTSAPIGTERLDEVVSRLCALAELLAAKEREAFTETQRMAVAQTMPIPKPDA